MTFSVVVAVILLLRCIQLEVRSRYYKQFHPMNMEGVCCSIGAEPEDQKDIPEDVVNYLKNCKYTTDVHVDTANKMYHVQIIFKKPR